MTPSGEDAPMLRDGHTVIRIDPKSALGPYTRVTHYHEVLKLGTSPIEKCIVFTERGQPACYRHLDCRARRIVAAMLEEEHQATVLTEEPVATPVTPVPDDYYRAAMAELDAEFPADLEVEVRC